MGKKEILSVVVCPEISKEINRIATESGFSKSYILNRILTKFFKKKLNLKEKKDVRF